MNRPDNKTIGQWRKLARSQKLKGSRRIELVDRLASAQNVYRLTGDSQEFVETPARAIKLVKTILNGIYKTADKYGRDRLKSTVIERLNFINGCDVPGFFRAQDPATIKVIPVKPAPPASTEELQRRAQEILRGGNSGN